MIGIADWTSRGKNLCQDLLALFERDAPQIVAVNVDEIEDVVQHRNVAAGIYATSMLTDAGALLHQAERCTALFVEGDNFAIKNCGDGLNKFGELMQLRILSGQIVLIARNQADAAVFDEGDGAIAIPLNIEQVFRIVEGLFDGDGQHGMDGDWHRALGRSLQFFNHRGHRGHIGILPVGGRCFRYTLTFFVFFYAVFWSLRRADCFLWFSFYCALTMFLLAMVSYPSCVFLCDHFLSRRDLYRLQF